MLPHIALPMCCLPYSSSIVACPLATPLAQLLILKCVTVSSSVGVQAQATRAGIVTCKHNVYNEFDFTSDVARWFNIRHVPSFLVFVDGALVDRCVLPDSRGGTYAPSHRVRSVLIVCHSSPGSLCLL